MSDISIKSDFEIGLMRESGRRLALVMEKIIDAIHPNVSTWEIDKLAEKMIFELDGEPSFKGYGDGENSFPATICASINEEIVHGIPTKSRILKDGDIFKIDIGMKYKGWHSDMARTVAVGEVDKNTQKIIKVVRSAFYKGVSVIKEGKTLDNYSKAVQKFVEKEGFSVVRNLVGHGIGRELHENPQIPNYFDKKKNKFKLKRGMTFALEPMINAGKHETILSNDGWTFKTADNSLSAHWENTVAITKNGVEILTEIE